MPPGLFERIRSMIRDEVGKLLRSGLLRSASISEGGLTIRGGGGLDVRDGGKVRVRAREADGGREVFYAGDIFSAIDGTYQGTGILVQQPDGKDIAVMRSDAAGGSIIQLRDSGERPVLATDTVTGIGLLRPYMGGHFARARYADWSVSTVSPDFETLWETRTYKQHSSIEVGVHASMDVSGATGEVRVLVDGVQLGAVAAIGFALSQKYFGPAAVAGTHLQALVIQIQGRRTSASGGLRVEPRYWLGREPA